jgi:23S rRNA (pseudouridine1915-N3)-methyltransferase
MTFSSMRLIFLWPGKTKSPELRAVEEFYAARIGALESLSIVETREARGLPEKDGAKIKELEARGLEKHLKGVYSICLLDRGKEMTSAEFARFLGRRAEDAGRPPAFVVGGFLGLADRIAERADLRLSLSRLTFSHELCRVVLLEQVYRALTIIRGRHYAK